MDQNLKTIFDFIQQNENLSADEKNTISKAVKDVDKELAITTFKLDRTEKVKRTTAILLEETIEELEQKRKAVEAQNRELEIEAALERIRAAALAMRDSSALSGIIYKLYSELTNLDAKLDRCFIMIVNPVNQGITWWMAGQEGLLAENGFFVQMNQHASHLMYLDYCKKREKKWTYLFEGKEKRDWDRFGFSKTELARLPEPIKAFMAAAKRVHLSGSSDQFGSLVTGSFEPLPDEQQEIISRFSVVFNQAYIRFLDLQKAEAQARESQIQLALERVRARTMAMQKSEELAETVSILFKQLLGVGVEFSKLRTCGIATFHEAEPKGNVFMSDINGDIISDSFEFRFDEAPSYKKIYAAREKEEKFMVLHLTGDALIEHFTYVKKYSNVSNIIMEKFGKEIPEIFIHVMFFSKGYLFVISYEPISEHHETLKRFGSLFQQTYTRFLDLQKAEAQAREAHIEAALERVRSRSMGMQKSEELREIIQVIYEQFVHLDIHVDSAGFGTDYMESDDFNFWFADSYSTYPKKVHIPYFDHPQFNSLTEAKAKGVDFYAKSLTFDEKNEFFDHVFKNSPPIPQEFKDALYSAPGYVSSHAILKNLVLYILNYTDVPFSDEENAILMRFGKAFEQAYIRFLDLQKAEAQAREAQIEAALEKVRSSSLAMHKSDELREIVKVVFEKLKELNFAIDGGAFIGTTPENSDHFNYWIADDQTKYVDSFKLPRYDAPTITDIWIAKESGLDFILKTYSFYEKNIWFEYAFKYTELKTALPEDFMNWILEQEYLSQAFAIQKNSLIGLHFHHKRELSENEIDILKRFSRVFEQGYVRFLDLQKAESQAREAKIEAALEKVRSRSLAMHKSDELQEVINNVYDRLNELDIKMDGVAIDIFQDSGREFDAWLASPNGNYSARMHIPDIGFGPSKVLMDARENGDEFCVYKCSFEEKNKWFNFVFEHTDFRHVPEDRKRYILDAKFWNVALAIFRNSAMQLNSYTLESFSERDISILQRFGKVFEQAYIRFLDLQKAEEQAREAQIETALEKVRSRSLAMHKSDELQEVINNVYNRLNELDIKMDAVNIDIFQDSGREFDAWVASPGGNFSARIHIPDIGFGPSKVLMDARENGNEFCVYKCSFEEKNKWFNFVFEHTNFRYVPDDRKRYILEGKFWNVAFAIFRNSAIQLNSYSLESFSERDISILQRFGKVFEQAYIRFLDLQKAEAQAREAQIETALEKVRSRSLAMHKSDELQQVINTVYDQLKELDIQMDAVNIDIFPKSGREFDAWIASPVGNYSTRIHIPDIGFGPSNALMDAWENGEEFCSYTCSFEEKNKWFNFAYEHTDMRFVPDDRKQYILGSKLWTVSFVLSKYSAFQLNSFTLNKFPDRYNEILKRFGNVFEQAYIRFLDLQKAEAQAREAQIEASLERLRSKTMAMHNSHDVGESVATMFDELERLDVKTKRCGVLIHGNPVNTEVWTARSNPDGKAALIIGRLDMTVHPLLSGARNSWLNKESSFSYELTGDDIINYFRAINDTKNYPYHFNIETLPSNEYHTDFHFRDGSIFAFTAEPIPAEALLIFNRFASVFGQTYRRYLDLKKAEAQAREAQIEAALERVRASTMAMHKSEQLAETAKVLFEQFDLLGKIPDRISIGIIKEEKQLIEWWVTNQNGSQLNYGFNASIAEPSMAKIVAAWKEKKESIVIDLTGKDLQDWIRFVREEVKMEIDEANMKGRRVHQGAFFSQGVLLFSTHEPVTNDVMHLLVRFARVFNQTYTRFLDLQKAEMQAKEAIKASSLDRVRGEIASMRTINDLQRITPIIWHELTALGVPFVRCGVFIMNEVTEHVQVHLSAPDGRSLGLLDLPFNSIELTINSVNHWRQGIIFKTHWGKDEFLNFMKTMIDQGQIRNQETYQGAATPPESLHLHFVPFKQGMLYVGSSLPLEVDELQLVKSLAESFSIAYARYEDFRQLEEAKNQIEKTFTELKAAQSQLIQAEKMASLGELTAGIAHEIQNPLNFVNNFSEVSNELMDEMKEEMANGNMQLANEIVEDIKQNLIKINHHGKRAADIVKGMLQHSRTSSGVKEPTDINALADEYLRLAYHGLRAKDKSFNAEFVTDFDETLPKINVIPQDIGRVLLNLINNAFYAVSERAKLLPPPPPEGGSKNDQIKYVPTVTISTAFQNPPSGGRGVRVAVKDNGLGIPDHIVDKIFQPFFTTKPTGQGTGLGLSLSYDIVKAHGGELRVETKEGVGSEFIIQLLIN